MKRFLKPKLTFNLVVVLVIFLVLVIESNSIAGFRPAFAATPCTPYEFIGARGSGESAQPHSDSPPYSADNNYGMGDLVFNVYANLTNLVGADKITAYGVHYPAVSLLGSLSNVINGAGAFLHIKPLGAYTDSVRQGTQDVQNQIETVHASCPTTQFILSGYSQGAQAVGDALQRMPVADQQLVVAATFFGDPYFNANSWSSRASDNSHFGILGERNEWPEFLHGDIFSYCQPHDPICGGDERQHILGDGDVLYRDLGLLSNFDFTPHGAYQSSGDAADAARELARVLGATTPPTGTVPLDLVFAIDTTGSMGGEIAQVRDNVTALANTIASTSANYRFALVDYKDGPDQGDPYRAQVDLNFTTDVASFANAVSTLSASGGGDYPESVYSGVMTALGLPWRTGVRKIVIVIGDAPGKDPEPQTNYTLDTVRQKALAVDPAQVYTVALTSEPTANTFMQNLANATGGQFVSQPDLSNFVPTLESTIIKAGSAPLADAGGPYSGIINDPVTFSAGGSRDDSEKIIKYDWDFNGDGVYDATTDNPVTSYAYSSTGKYNLTVRVRSASGLAATATSTVTITAAPSIPSAPISLTATASDSAITLTWANASGGGQPQWYTITDATGSVIDRVSAQADGSPPSAWVDTDLTNGVAYSYKVSAGNAAGESPAAGPVTATPHVANQPPTANPDSYSTDNQTQLVIPVPGVLANDFRS